MPRVSHNILKDILSGMRTVYLSFPFVQTVCPGSCLLPILLGRNIGKNCLPAVTITAATASPIYPPRNLPRFSYHFLSQFFKFSRLVAGLVAGMAVSTKTLAIYCRPIFTFGRESSSLKDAELWKSFWNMSTTLEFWQVFYKFTISKYRISLFWFIV